VIFATLVLVGGLSLALVPSAGADSPEGWSTIKGQIVWGGGAVPEHKTIDVSNHQDKACCLAKGPVLSEDWVIDKDNKGIYWTYVWLAPESPSGKLPIHPDLEKIQEKEVIVDQPACQFVPHAVALRQGQALVAKNSAPVAHNVRWTGGFKNPGNNLIVPSKGSHTISNLVADKYPIKLECNIHPWMSGWVRVFDHPYFAVTDADGKFEIKNAPAGKFRLFIWQESSGFRGGAAGRNGEEIIIKPGTVTDLGKLDLKPSS
jgi:hypothetical protein